MYHVCRMGIGMLPSRLFFILSQTSTTIGSWRLAWRCDDDVYCDTVGSTILLSCNRWGSFIRVIGSESASAVRVERNSLSRAAPRRTTKRLPTSQWGNPTIPSSQASCFSDHMTIFWGCFIHARDFQSGDSDYYSDKLNARLS
jgi:hypothetical protein